MKAQRWILLMLIAGSLQAQPVRHTGAGIPRAACLLPHENRLIAQEMIRLERPAPAKSATAVLFSDPMGGGGTNSFGKTIVNYVDHDATSGLQDYRCGKITYDGHQGTDIEILDFYDMDEGVPVLCAAPGVVIQTHDGEFDRRTKWQSGVRANSVVVRHADGSQAWYLHFKKNSLRVSPGDTVATGDTLGLVGSSGFSSGPHIHFEVHDNGIVDPYQGFCQSAPSRWLEQGTYVLDLPFELMIHGVSTMPISWAEILERPPSKTHVQAGSKIYSWIRARNIHANDMLRWEFYANGTFWDSYSFSPGTTYSSSYWYIYWTLPQNANLYGTWEIRIIRNGERVATQTFTYDAAPNQLPQAQDQIYALRKGETLSGEFTATDPDGTIYKYVQASNPAHGAFVQYGGRARKFKYTPQPNFVGQDVVTFYAVDDENAAGPPANLTFNVSEGAVAVTPIGRSGPEQFALEQNYPNPFNPATQIRYMLRVDANVTLKVFTLAGKELHTLVQERQRRGAHTVRWDAGSLPSGVYLFYLSAGGFQAVRKGVLVR